MLTVNVWEGSDKWTLVFGSHKVLGHASVTIEATETAKSTYISWWPSGDDGTGGKDYGSERVKDRSFAEDAWAEGSHRFRGEVVFTLPLSVADDLETYVEDERQEARGGRNVIPNSVANGFTGKHELSDQVLIGVIVPEELWGLDDVKNKRAYTLYKAKSGVKVTAIESHHQLWEHETANITGLVPGKGRGRYGDGIVKGEQFPQALKALLQQKKVPIVFDSETCAHRMAHDQIFVVGRKLTGYISITQGKGELYNVRYHHWTRQQIAPTANIAIPTLGDGGKGLDDDAIRRWWTVFNAPNGPRWSRLQRNCSVIAMMALKVGGAGRYAKPHIDSSWICWTPSDVKQYAMAVAKAIESGAKAPKPVAPEGAKKLPSVDFAKDTIVWTKKQFEKASKLKGLIETRSKELQKIDTALDEYHQYSKQKNFPKRSELLMKVADLIADFFHAKPDTKRAAAILELGERVIAEQAIMVAGEQAWDAKALERARALVEQDGLDNMIE